MRAIVRPLDNKGYRENITVKHSKSMRFCMFVLYAWALLSTIKFPGSREHQKTKQSCHKSLFIYKELIHCWLWWETKAFLVLGCSVRWVGVSYIVLEQHNEWFIRQKANVQEQRCQSWAHWSFEHYNPDRIPTTLENMIFQITTRGLSWFSLVPR